MGVIIDQVDGELHDQPSAAALPASAPASGAAQPDVPETALDELEHQLAVMQRRRRRLHAD